MRQPWPSDLGFKSRSHESVRKRIQSKFTPMLYKKFLNHVTWLGAIPLPLLKYGISFSQVTRPVCYKISKTGIEHLHLSLTIGLVNQEVVVRDSEAVQLCVFTQQLSVFSFDLV